MLGAPWQADGAWFYPRENYQASETGLAVVYPSDHADLTADGEAFDQSALAAAHQTLQLPAIARVTDLDTGRQVVVRINDRGPPTPHRMLEVTRRTAVLLGMPMDGIARVRMEVLPEESHAAVDVVPGAPSLEIAAAPVGAVQATELPPPGGAAAPTLAEAAPSTPAQAASAPPLRLPEIVTQTSADPGQLYVRLGEFHSYQYANMQRAQVGGLGASIVSTFEGRARTFLVIIGPLGSVQEADAVLDQVLAAGVTDAGIVVK
jgi:rare lipoprotein A